jgi:outer membrane protein assembly factor BamE (lipoprotein component of BamABCDE complex)
MHSPWARCLKWGRWSGFWLVLSMLWIPGCTMSEPRVTLGREFPYERLPGIRKGITTRQQVEELLGKPLRVDKISDEREMWRYFYRQETERRFAYFFREGMDVVEKEVNVYFDGPFVMMIKYNLDRF